MKRKRMTKAELWKREKVKRALGRESQKNLSAHRETIFVDGDDTGFCVLENQGLII